MHVGCRIAGLILGLLLLGSGPGCATMRQRAGNLDFRPCTDGFAETADGWRLGVRHYPPSEPDPSKDPVVLCHGLGLNGTFWTITDDHLPRHLAEKGYEVFVVDLRGSGASHRRGAIGRFNSAMRQTFFREIGVRGWTMDDEALYDVPAILDYVCDVSGKQKVNWIGHSLGGMMMFAFLQRSPDAERVGTLVAMGSPAYSAVTPQTGTIRATKGIRALLWIVSTGRMARPMALLRPPGIDRIDNFYFTAENVDRRTINRFYRYTLEDLGPGALRQLDAYLRDGPLVSADRQFNYYEGLTQIQVPTLLVAGDGDVIADLPSKGMTFERLGSPDKTLFRYGVNQGHHADYGHCDLVWSRFAPMEVFPDIIEWLDARQGRPGLGPQRPTQPWVVAPNRSVPLPSRQQSVDAEP